jgi:hypothetical protein
MSKQFVSANYRSYKDDQEKMRSFEREMESLEISSDAESKRANLEVAQRLRSAVFCCWITLVFVEGEIF